jgi:hypothetical protein
VTPINGKDLLAGRYGAPRTRLRAVTYRIWDILGEVDDAVGVV